MTFVTRLSSCFPHQFVAALGLAIALTATQPIAAQAEQELRDGYVETFGDTGYRDRWFFANYEQGGDRFVTAWRRKMASVVLPVAKGPYEGGALTLRLEPAPEGESKKFFGAEVQMGGKHHYGDYEVVMQAAKGSGLVTAFFTYTGPYFDDPHDEIDVEILGKDTNQVWINRFVGGERLPGRLVPLGFDAAASPNLYRIEWREDSITWFANGTEIFRVDGAEHAIPAAPGKVFLSLWAGGPVHNQWLGETPPDMRATAKFLCASYRPLGDPRGGCAERMQDPS